MDFEFDKEIDVLLRQSAQGETVFSAANPKSRIPNPKSAHLDADEISAFAENALPEKIKQQYTLHLADCDKCRKNLSSLIRLNSEESSEIVHAEEKHFVAAPISWYRKLFAFPSLAYTMGALVLVFSGIAVYTVLQTVGDSQNAEVSQTTYDKQPNGKGMSSDGDQAMSESYSSNTAAVSNSAMSNAATAMNSSNSAANFSAVPSVPMSATNSNASAMRDAADKDAPAGPKPIAPAREPMTLATPEDSTVAGVAPAPPPPPPAKENDYSAENEVLRQQAQTQNSIAQNQTEIYPDSRNVKRAPMPALRAEGKNRKAEDSRDDALEKSKSAATTNVGGKTFKRENNVWYDAAYRGQATINVTRGTNQYKKLDSGLRGIAENLGGTVVVVWKSKAYRIQ